MRRPLCHRVSACRTSAPPMWPMSFSLPVPPGGQRVTIDHRGAVNTLQAVNRRLSLTAEDALFALSELSFDLSVYDIFGALSVGAEIVLPAQESVKDPERWLPLLAEREVTVWNSVPQLAGLLADAVARQGCSLPRLRAFLMSGD